MLVRASATTVVACGIRVLRNLGATDEDITDFVDRLISISHEDVAHYAHYALIWIDQFAEDQKHDQDTAN